jgi:hypothetical protein
VTGTNEIKKSSWGGRRKGSGRKPRFHRAMTSAERKSAGTDDLAERLAAHDAIVELMGRLSERLQASNEKSELKFVLGFRTGFQGALAEADAYLAEIRLDGEQLQVTRVRFRA